MKQIWLLFIVILSGITSAQSLFNFQAGDKFQYQSIREEEQDFYFKEIKYYSHTISTKEYQGKTYYTLMVSGAAGWYRYDSTEQKLYYLLGQEEKLAYDFTKPAGVIEQLYLRGSLMSYKYNGEANTTLFGENLRQFSAVPQDTETGSKWISLVEKYGFLKYHFYLNMGYGFREYTMQLIGAIVDSVEYGRFNISMAPEFPLLNKGNSDYIINTKLNHFYRDLISNLKADFQLYGADTVIYSNTFNGSITDGKIVITMPVNLLEIADSAGVKISCNDTSIFNNSVVFPSEGYHIIKVYPAVAWNLVIPQYDQWIAGYFVGMKFFTQDIGYVWYNKPPDPGDPNALPTVLTFRTTNGGTTFAYVASDYGVPNYEIMRLNQDYAYKFRHWGSSNLYKTTNSGNNWQEITLPNNSKVNKIYFIDHYTGWVSTKDLSNNAKLYRTKNGGVTFKQVGLPPGEVVESISFESNDKGYLLASSGKFYVTQDSGYTWTITGIQFTGYNKVRMFPGGKGWLTGPAVLKTTDGGLSWTNSLSKPVTDAYFFDENIAWVIAGSLRYTSNGGDSWELKSLPGPTNNLQNIDFVDRDHGWVMIYGGNIYRTKNGGLVFVEDEEFNKDLNNYSLYQNYPNPFNPVTKIRYTLPSKQHVTIKIFNILGKEVAALVNEEKEKGNYEEEFNAGAFNLSSGIYLYNISISGFNETRKMVYLK